MADPAGRPDFAVRMQAAREAVATMNAQLQDEGVKDWLHRRITLKLDDVDTCLKHAAEEESQAAAVMWLDSAEISINAAEDQLRRLQGYVDAYGPGVKLVG